MSRVTHRLRCAWRSSPSAALGAVQGVHEDSRQHSVMFGAQHGGSLLIGVPAACRLRQVASFGTVCTGALPPPRPQAGRVAGPRAAQEPKSFPDKLFCLAGSVQAPIRAGGQLVTCAGVMDARARHVRGAVRCTAGLRSDDAL